MMSPENIPPATDTHSSGNRKSSSAQKPQQQPQDQQPPLKCPRCDSSNTKFCYYNNYSLSQPRHFCKTCRRYWTKGGALRNVPIGGGCRKTKKLKSSSSSVSAVVSNTSCAAAASRALLSGGDDFGLGLKFLSGPASVPAMEFQLGGLSLPRLHPATAGVYTQFITSSGSGPGAGSFGLDLLGLNYSLPNSAAAGTTSSPASTVVQGSGEGDHQISLSSIESLSTINQEMHWKLQQQRLALIYGPPSDKDKDKVHGGAINLFQNLEITSSNNNHHNHNNNNNNSNPKQSDSHEEQHIICGRKLEVGPTEWFFDQTTNYAPTRNNNNNNNNTSAPVTTEGWSDLHHFNGLQ